MDGSCVDIVATRDLRRDTGIDVVRNDGLRIRASIREVTGIRAEESVVIRGGADKNISRHAHWSGVNADVEPVLRSPSVKGCIVCICLVFLLSNLRTMYLCYLLLQELFHARQSGLHYFRLRPSGVDRNHIPLSFSRLL